MRIKIKDLEMQVERLNEIFGKIEGQIGSYTLSGAYGGWQLQQIVNEARAVDVPLGYGFLPKKELFCKINAFLKGIDIGKYTNNKKATK